MSINKKTAPNRAVFLSDHPVEIKWIIARILGRKEKYMNIILWIVFGAIVGWAASIIMKTDAEMGIGSNIIVGILGALLGGWVVTLFGGPDITGFNLSSFLVAILGAVILLWIVRGFRSPLKGRM